MLGVSREVCAYLSLMTYGAYYDYKSINEQKSSSAEDQNAAFHPVSTLFYAELYLVLGTFDLGIAIIL